MDVTARQALLVVLGGAVAVLAGVCVLWGVGWTLIVGGCAAVAAGLLVDGA